LMLSSPPGPAQHVLDVVPGVLRQETSRWRISWQVNGISVEPPRGLVSALAVRDVENDMDHGVVWQRVDAEGCPGIDTDRERGLALEAAVQAELVALGVGHHHVAPIALGLRVRLLDGAHQVLESGAVDDQVDCAERAPTTQPFALAAKLNDMHGRSMSHLV